MSRAWKAMLVGLALSLALVAGGVACGGGSSDEDKIESRAKAFVDHINKADAKALINDLPPDARRGCDEAAIKRSTEQLKELKFKLHEVAVTSVDGDRAVADLTVSINDDDENESTSPQKFVKVGGNWYIDPEGGTCADLLG